MPTSDDANESRLAPEAHDEDGELTIDALDQVVGGKLIYNKTSP